MCVKIFIFVFITIPCPVQVRLQAREVVLHGDREQWPQGLAQMQNYRSLHGLQPALELPRGPQHETMSVHTNMLHWQKAVQESP